MGIGKRIKATLEERGWERGDLMDRVPDLTPQALSNLIRRDSKRSEWDEAIAAALGVSVLWLVYGHEPNTRPGHFSAQEPAPLPWLIHKAVELLQSTSHDGQLVALGRLEEIAARYPFSNLTDERSQSGCAPIDCLHLQTPLPR